MLPLAARLLDDDPAQRLVAISGDNPRLHERLAALARGAGGRLAALGFTDRVAEVLEATDVLVTKPGPGSLSEAFQHRVPVVVTRNVHTIPQERFNTDFARDRGLGTVVRPLARDPGGRPRLRTDPARREAIRARLAALPENRAVYEVVDVIRREAGVTPSSHV